MSDEDSYEYDDDAMEEEEDDDNFEYTDEEEEASEGEVLLENSYYNAKGLRENGDYDDALEAFEQVITKEQEEMSLHNSGAVYGIWSYKAMKQRIKVYLRTGPSGELLREYTRLLECIAKGNVGSNAIERGIHGMLERISSLLVQRQQHTRQSHPDSGAVISDPQTLAGSVYDATLRAFHPKMGASPNERLWFKTNIKYGQLLYEMNEAVKLQQVLKDLQSSQQETMTGEDGGSASGSQSMEIYALQMQLYSRQKDNKKLRSVFQQAMAVRGGIPHPRTLALIQELGGKMHMAAREYEQAGKTFFQAFKSYDEAGDPSRLKCLKYLVMASMLHSSTINPFDSQEARPYRDDPEILAMTNLVQAFHNNEIQTFERILRRNEGRIMDDEFVREHVEDLLRTIRTQVLRSVIRPYTRISLKAISEELNDIPVEDVENLLVGLILDGKLEGRIDQIDGILFKEADKGGTGSAASVRGGSKMETVESPEEEKFRAVNELLDALQGLSTSVTSSSSNGNADMSMRPVLLVRGT